MAGLRTETTVVVSMTGMARDIGSLRIYQTLGFDRKNYMTFMCRPKIELQADVVGKTSYLRLWLINWRDYHPLSTWILPDTCTQSATKRA